jgi:hypothetical protein
MEYTRINSSQLGQHIGHNVSLSGKVLNADVSHLLLESSDHGQVTIVRKPGSYMPNSKYMEIIGNVGNDLTIKEMYAIGLGDNFGKFLVLLKIMTTGKVS